MTKSQTPSWSKVDAEFDTLIMQMGNSRSLDDIACYNILTRDKSDPANRRRMMMQLMSWVRSHYVDEEVSK